MPYFLETEFPYAEIRDDNGDYFQRIEHAVRAGYDLNQIWTVTECDGVFTYGPSHHYVNLLGYVATVETHDGETYYCEPMIEMDDNASFDHEDHSKEVDTFTDLDFNAAECVAIVAAEIESMYRDRPANVFEQVRDIVGSAELRDRIIRSVAPMVETLWNQVQKQNEYGWQEAEHLLPCFDFSFVPFVLRLMDYQWKQSGRPDVDLPSGVVSVPMDGQELLDGIMEAIESAGYFAEVSNDDALIDAGMRG